MKKIFRIMTLLTIVAVINACGDDDKVDSKNKALEEKTVAYVKNYVEIVYASYLDAYNETVKIQKDIRAFVASPSSTTFTVAKNSWLAARKPYGETEVYRFYEGPIDGDEGEPEGYINAWPLDEALIDYVKHGTGGQQLSDKRQNVVNNKAQYPKIDKKVLRDLSGYDKKEENVTIGYHAIEFLLWGQDNTPPSDKKPGQRAFTDYTTKENADRRKQYLTVVTDILVEDLKSVLDQWSPNGAYRKKFLALSPNDAIDKILTGAAKLSKGELAGERMATAVKNQSQEDEHSCFADNTHTDIFRNAKGITNVLTGTYTKLDGTKINGTSLFDVLTLVDATLTAKLKTTSADALIKVGKIAIAKYFDFQIVGETIDNVNKPVMAAVTSLRTQGDQIAAAGKAITGKTIDPSV